MKPTIQTRRDEKKTSREPQDVACGRFESEIRYCETSICFLLVRFSDEAFEQYSCLDAAGVFRADVYSGRVARAIVAAFPAACELAAKQGFPVSTYTIAECVPAELREEIFRELQGMFDPKTEPPYHDETHILPIDSILRLFRRLLSLREKRRFTLALRDAGALADSGEYEAASELVGKANTSYILERSEKNAVSSAAPDVADWYESESERRAAMSKIPTGFKTLDTLLFGGFAPGALTFLGGTPGAGKTAFAQQIAVNAAKNGASVLFFSCELPLFDFVSRLLSMLSAQDAVKSVPSDSDAIARALRSSAASYTDFVGNNAAKGHARKEALNRLASLYRLRLFDEPRDTADEICRKISEMIELGKTSASPLVVIDYLQTLDQYSSVDKRVAVDRSIAAFKAVAKRYSLPILCLSSLARGGYDVPVSSEHFKETGMIESSADRVLAIQRVDVFPRRLETGRLESRDDVVTRIRKRESAEGEYAFSAADGERLPLSRSLVVSILKNRTGNLGNAAIEFFPEYMFFVDRGVFKREER